MRYLGAVFLTYLMVVLMSCASTYEFTSDTEPNVNFKHFSTYSILHDSHGFEQGTDTLNRRRIDEAIEEEVEKMGYEFSDNPDLQISWFIKVDTKLEQGVYNAYYSKWRSPRAIDVHEYQEGSLVLDFVDTHTGKIVWHIKVSSKIDDKIKNIDQEIKKVVKEIFKSYKKDSGIKKVNAYAVK